MAEVAAEPKVAAEAAKPAAGEPKASELADLPAPLAKVLESLTSSTFDAAGGWITKGPWEKKEVNAKGEIMTKQLGGDANHWVRSLTEIDGVSKKVVDHYWDNIDKYAVNKPDIKEAKATAKDGDVVSELYMTFPMPILISNRDCHCAIKKFKWKDGEVCVWRSIKKKSQPCPSGWVRMKMLGFSFEKMLSENKYQCISYDQIDMGGSLPTMIVNKIIGSPADWEQMAKDCMVIKKGMTE